jgi:hypothetical protein
MALDTVGILTPIAFSAEQPTVITTVRREVFVDEAPLFAQLNHVQATAETFTVNSYQVRARSYNMGAGDLTAGATSLPMTDASMIQVGDVLELNDGTNMERVEVTAQPNVGVSPNTVTIRRGRESTTGTAFLTATPTVITIVGNSRTGGEIDQVAFRTVVTPTQQIVQTFQYAVEVGGKAEAIQNVSLPPGVSSVFARDRAIKAVEFTRDVEYSMYYGRGEAPAAVGDRAKMKGLRALSGNVKTTGGASYTRASFIADTIQKIYNAGGIPDTIVCSTDFLGGLDTWVPGKTSYMEETTDTLGFPIESFVVPLAGKPMRIQPSLQMRAGTAAVISTFDLDVRYIREMYWQPRERRGDAMEGDWIGDFSLGLGHSTWHAWIEGITSYA